MQKIALKLMRKLSYRIPSVHMKMSYIIISLLIGFTIFSGFETSAQEIKEMNSSLTALEASSDAINNTSAKHLEYLLYDLHSAVFIQQGQVSTFSEAPFVSVETDAQSVAQLYASNLLFSHAELLTIRINNPEDLNLSLDIANLKGFPDLKYINFLCAFDCTAEQVRNLIKNADSSIIVFYLVSIPS